MGDADWGAALAGGARQAVVTLVAVELQDSVKAGEEAPGIFTAASGGVKIDHPRRVVTAPSAVVAGQRPEIPGRRVEDAPPARCAAAPRIEHRRRGVLRGLRRPTGATVPCELHEQLGGRLQMLGQPIHHRPEVERGNTDPIRQRAAMDIDARAGEDLALSV